MGKRWTLPLQFKYPGYHTAEPGYPEYQEWSFLSAEYIASLI